MVGAALLWSLPAEAAPPPTSTAVGVAGGVPVEAAGALDRPVRGLSVQAQVGGGYMVMDRRIVATPTFPALTGRSEMLGAGPAVSITVALDVLPILALQVTGGMTYAGARRPDYVHSLSQAYGAIGARFMLPLNGRWVAHLTPGVALVWQNDAVDASQSGAGVILAAGGEYYAHMRHFSVGADVSVQAPLAPARLFVGIMPHVRYTF